MKNYFLFPPHFRCEAQSTACHRSKRKVLGFLKTKLLLNIIPRCCSSSDLIWCRPWRFMIWRYDSRRATKVCFFSTLCFLLSMASFSVQRKLLISFPLSGFSKIQYSLNTRDWLYITLQFLFVMFCKGCGYFAVNEAYQDVCWPLSCLVRALSFQSVLCNQAPMMDISILADSPLRSGANQCRFFVL